MSGTGLSLQGYKLTFDSEFADMSNSDFGLPGTPGITWETEVFYKDTSNGGQGTVNPTPPGQPGSLFSLQNGMLVENMTPTEAPYLDTNPNGVPGGFSQQYGYFEVNAKLVGTSGYNSDFWMMPNSGPWPPEFDVYEHNGYIAGDYEMTNHGGDASTPPQNLDLYTVPNLTTSFNTFGFMWTPTTLTWFINGQEVFSAPTASNENQPFNLILSGGPSYLSWLPPPLAGTSDQYDIKWVHAYSNDPNATAIGGMPGYQDHDGSTSLGATATTGGTSGGSGGTPTPSTNYITPGVGSFTDAAGNVYTLSSTDIATENGKAMNGGGGTGAMEYANGTVYAKDASSGTWYTWSAAKNDWSLASSPPPPPTSSGGSSSDSGSGGNTGSTGATNPVLISPGSGSFTDAAGNVYTLDAQDNALENGKPMNGGGGTGAMEYADGIVYAKDAGSGTWYEWSASQNNWTLAPAAPPTPGSSTSGGGTTTPPPPPPPPSSVTAGTGADALVLSISEDAYLGDAQFTVSVDGHQIGSTFTALAPHSSGQDQTFTLNGDWSSGSHTVSVNFLNDAYGGTAATDRNLYVDHVTYDGADQGKSLTLMSQGAQTFTFTDRTPAVVNGTMTLTTMDTNDTVSTSNITIAATAGDHILFLSGSGNTVNLTGGTETVTTQAGATGTKITTGDGDDTITLGSSGNTATAGDGINSITDNTGGNTIVLPGANKGFDDLFGSVLSNGDKLDLRPALAGTNWNGSASSIGSFVRVAMDGSDALVMVSKRAHGGGAMIADLHGVGATNLQTLLAHSIT